MLNLLRRRRAGLRLFAHDLVFLLDQIGHGRADRDGAVDRCDRPGQETFLEHLDVHHRLVGLDGGDDGAAGDSVAGLLFPGHHHALGHGVGELRHNYAIQRAWRRLYSRC